MTTTKIGSKYVMCIAFTFEMCFLYSSHFNLLHMPAKINLCAQKKRIICFLFLFKCLMALNYVIEFSREPESD